MLPMIFSSSSSNLAKAGSNPSRENTGQARPAACPEASVSVCLVIPTVTLLIQFIESCSNQKTDLAGSARLFLRQWNSRFRLLRSFLPKVPAPPRRVRPSSQARPHSMRIRGDLHRRRCILLLRSPTIAPVSMVLFKNSSNLLKYSFQS